MARGGSSSTEQTHRGSISTTTSTATSASSSGSHQGARFDASKQGTIPASSLHAPPRDEPAVLVGFVDSTIGLGLFAARHIAKGEFIFHERPFVTAVFNEMNSDNRDDMRTQEAAVKQAQAGPPRLAMDLAFPHLAAVTGHFPYGYDSDVIPIAELGINLVHGRLESELMGSPDELRSYVHGLQVADSPSKTQRRTACREFFKHYAFQSRASKSSAAAPSSLTPSKACVYLLGSLINHCCPGNPGPNCEFQVGPGGLSKFVERDAIAVRARRDIKAGKELTFNYGKQRKGFDCHCKTCESKPPGREELCIVM
ncbi:SET domain-containing protein [Thozetella sp. PMI_491]|nr:SET domain-containing protein [Thozetella sp. PMI_491]